MKKDCFRMRALNETSFYFYFPQHILHAYTLYTFKVVVVYCNALLHFSKAATTAND